MAMTTTNAKAETFLSRARKRGLLVTADESGHAWTIKSEFTARTGFGHSMILTALDGPRGGRLGFYICATTGRPKRLRTRAEATSWLATLAD